MQPHEHMAAVLKAVDSLFAPVTPITVRPDLAAVQRCLAPTSLYHHDYVDIATELGTLSVFFERNGGSDYTIKGYMLGSTQLREDDIDADFRDCFDEHIALEIKEINASIRDGAL